MKTTCTNLGQFQFNLYSLLLANLNFGSEFIKFNVVIEDLLLKISCLLIQIFNLNNAESIDKNNSEID